MNAMPDSITVNSCQYTPVYLIQDPGASQGQSYFITQSSVEELKPVSDNLKSFYESSGNIENSFVNVNSSPKPRILKKQDGGIVGNNLKLASFLLPKNESSNQQQYVVNNVILKPNVTLSTSTLTSNTVNNTVNNPVTNTVSTTSTINTVPRLNIDSKIVKLNNTTFNGTTLKAVDARKYYNRVEKASPKIKPKEIPPILQATPSKHTSVQLLKLGETYHSLNQLSDDQMKMVTQALKYFSNPEKIQPELAYDPVTNTKFFYKVVSPRDLTVVGKNKVVAKEKRQHEPIIDNIIKADIKKDHIIRSDIRKETITKEFLKKDIIKKEPFVKDIVKKDVLKKENLCKHEIKKENIARRHEEKLLKQKIQRAIEEEQEMAEALVETSQPKVTRSGRKVKLPKLSLPEGIPQKPKKKNTYVTCFQCAAEFPSLYRLQKHYEAHPTHIPAKIHSNLFHCLLAIVKSGTEGDRTNIFIQQLEQLIVKLRSLLPCLLKNSGEETKACTISEDVGRLLGMNPGKYHLDIEALSCVKNKDGYCHHRPPPPPPPKDMKQEQIGTQSWIPINNEDNVLVNTEVDTEDCARINSVEKWPTVSKRVWKQKQQRSQENAKRMRLSSENCDTLIELGMDDLVILGKPDECPEHSAIIDLGSEPKADSGVVIKIEQDDIPEQEVCANIVEQEPLNSCTFEQPPETAIMQTDTIEDQKKQSNHAQFHSAHFDIRSSPIKPTSTIFRKFQINPELLAKYEAQIIRSIETVDKDHDTDKDMPCPTVEEVLQTNENGLQDCSDVLNRNDNVLQTSADVLHTKDIVLQTRPHILHTNQNILQNNQDLLHANRNVLQTSNVLNPNENALQISRNVLHINGNILQTTRDLMHTNGNVLQSSRDIVHSNENVLETSRDLLHQSEDVLQSSRNVLCINGNLLQNSPNLLHVNENLSNGLHVNENVLQTSQDILQSNENDLSSRDVLQANDDVRNSLVNDDTLQEIFRDEDLSAVKESFILDRELKDWILNRSNDEKSEDGFSRSSSLIEPALLHVRDDEIKSQLNIGEKVNLPTNDNHDESSVLNFLDTLATDCLSYPGTEIRTNNGDFQMDLFSFHNS